MWVKQNHLFIYREITGITSPRTENVDVCSSRSIAVTPGIRRACIMLAPCVPMARPIRSWRTRNSSQYGELGEPRVCRVLCQDEKNNKEMISKY